MTLLAHITTTRQVIVSTITELCAIATTSEINWKQRYTIVSHLVTHTVEPLLRLLGISFVWAPPMTSDADNVLALARALRRVQRVLEATIEVRKGGME